MSVNDRAPKVRYPKTSHEELLFHQHSSLRMGVSVSLALKPGF